MINIISHIFNPLSCIALKSDIKYLNVCGGWSYVPFWDKLLFICSIKNIEISMDYLVKEFPKSGEKLYFVYWKLCYIEI